MIDVIQRYRPVVQIINRLDIQELLEIGSSSYGIIRFYEGKVIGLDIQFEDEREIAENLIPVLGSACLLPFKDGCFEAVVCVHMLEHIPSKARSSAIREMLRVSKNILCFLFHVVKRVSYMKKNLIDSIRSFLKIVGG